MASFSHEGVVRLKYCFERENQPAIQKAQKDSC